MAIELQPRLDEGSRVLQDSKEPLQLSGALEEYKRFNVTTNIGTEFAREVQLTDIIKSDEKIRDLAILGKLHGYCPSCKSNVHLLSGRFVVSVCLSSCAA